MGRTVRFLLVLALVGTALLVAGCTQSPTPAAKPAPATPKPAAAAGAAIRMADGVQVVTIESGEFKFSPASLALKPGKTKFVVANAGVIMHDFAVLNPGADAKTAAKAHVKEMGGSGSPEEMAIVEKAALLEIEDTQSGKTRESAVVELTPGTYEMACLIPGHYEAGQKGTVVVQ